MSNHKKYPKEDNQELLETLAIKTSLLEKLNIFPKEDLWEIRDNIELELENRNNLSFKI